MSTAAEPDDATVPDWARDYSWLPPDHPSRHRQRHQPQHVQEAQYREVIERSGTLPLLKQMLHGHRGRQSRLGIEGALVAAMRALAERRTYKRSEITAEVAKITDETAAEVGIADRNESPISYSTVATLCRKLEKALVDHARHPFHGDYGWLDEDGMYMLAYWWSDELIRASIPPEWRDKITAVAIDGTCWPAWATNRVFTPKKDIVAEFAQRRADELGLDEPDLSDLKNPCGTRPGELGPDGRPIPTLCPTVRRGHRTKTRKDQREKFDGHDLITAVAVRDFCWQGDPERYQLGPDVPQFFVGTRVIPASTHAAPSSAVLARNFERDFSRARDVIADRIITNSPDFVLTCHALGLNATMDYTTTEVANPKTPTFGRNQNLYYQHVGALFPGWLDPAIVEPPEVGTVDPETGEEVTEDDVNAWYTERAKLRCSVNRKLPGGGYQYQTPLAAGRIGTEHTMHTANQDAAEYPTDIVYPERYFKVPPAQAVRLQDRPWSTPAWDADYGRRSIVETGNSRAKNEGGFDEETCRIHDFVAHIIAATLNLVILNLEEVRRYELEHQETQEQANKISTATDKNNDTQARDKQPTDAKRDDLKKPEPDDTVTAASTHTDESTPEPDAAADNDHTTAPARSGKSNRQRRNHQRKQKAHPRGTPPNSRSPPKH